MAFKLFHLPKNRQFAFKPRYYDEQKEEFETRVEQIKRELGQSDNTAEDKSYSANIKGRMRGTLRRNRDASRQSNIRLLIIIFVLSLLAYFVFFR